MAETLDMVIVEVDGKKEPRHEGCIGDAKVVKLKGLAATSNREIRCQKCGEHLWRSEPSS